MCCEKFDFQLSGVKFLGCLFIVVLDKPLYRLGVYVTVCNVSSIKRQSAADRTLSALVPCHTQTSSGLLHRGPSTYVKE